MPGQYATEPTTAVVGCGSWPWPPPQPISYHPQTRPLSAGGIIRRSVALLDPARIGLGVRAITYVTLSRQGEDEGVAFEREMVTFPEVLECFAVTGESDYILQIVAASLSDLSESVLRRLTRIKCVNSIRSNIVPQSIKSSTELPLGQLGRG